MEPWGFVLSAEVASIDAIGVLPGLGYPHAQREVYFDFTYSFNESMVYSARLELQNRLA